MKSVSGKSFANLFPTVVVGVVKIALKGETQFVTVDSHIDLQKLKPNWRVAECNSTNQFGLR